MMKKFLLAILAVVACVATYAGMQVVSLGGDLENENTLVYVKSNVGGNSAITLAELEDGVGVDGSKGISVATQGGAANPWDAQFWISFGEVEEGTELTVSFDYKADAAAKVSSQGHTSPGNYTNNNGVGDVYFTTEWQHYEGKVTVAGGSNGVAQSIAFNLCEDKAANNVFYVDNVTVSYEKEVREEGEPEPVYAWVDITATEHTVHSSTGDNAGVNVPGYDNEDGIEVLTTKGGQEWDAQFWINFTEPLKANTQVRVSFDEKAEAAETYASQAHAAPGAYISHGIIGDIAFGTDWTTISKEFKAANGQQSIAFNLAKGDNKVYFRNIKVEAYLEVTGELEKVITPAFVFGEDEIALNNHSEVSVELAEGLKVNFENMPEVIGATYSVNEMVMGEDADGIFWNPGKEVAVGEMTLSGIGYATFDETIAFEQGKKYQLTVTPFKNAADPIEMGSAKYTFNGAAVVEAQDVELTGEMFCQWDGFGADANVVRTNAGACEWGKSTGLPYGDGNVAGSYFADLSAYSTLTLTVTEGTPRLLLNRQGMDNSGDFIEINGNAGMEYVISNEGGVWVYDLAKIVAEAGFAHLNCIKGANWANTTITEAKLTPITETPAELVLIPALVSGEEEYTLNNHSIVTVPAADAIKVNFENGAAIKYATYVINELVEDEFMGVVDIIEQEVASGTLSINAIGYATLDVPATFYYGHKYNVLIKAWDTEDYFDLETMTTKTPIATFACEFIGSTDATPGVAMGEFQIAMRPGMEIEAGEWEGLTISFPENNVAAAMAGSEALEYGAIATIVTNAQLYKEGVEEPVAEEFFASDFEIDNVTIFANVELEAGAKYTVVIPAGGVTVQNQMDWENPVIWESAEEITFEFNTAAPSIEGDYALMNVATGTYLNGANDWGTRASVTKHGQFFTVAKLEDGTYTLDSHISNGGESHFLGTNGYVDAGAAGYSVEAVSEGVYTIKSGANYLATNAENTIVEWKTVEATDAAAQWKLVSKADMLEATAEASKRNPVDLTALIADANFGRNNTDINLWQGDKPGIGGDNANMNAEKWGGNSQEFDFWQEISGLPAGVYTLNVQGYYRYNNTPDNTNDIAAATHADGSEHINSYFYANDLECPFTSIADEEAVATYGKMPFSQGEASAAFNMGLYSHSMRVYVGEDGILKLGVKKIAHEGCDWTVWDNFELYYLGETVVDMESALVLAGEEATLNDHSAVSIEKATGLKVNVIDCPQAIGVTYVINEMNLNQDEEGMFWTVGKEVAAGEAGMNAIAFAQFDKTLKFAAGKKYQLTVTVMGQPADEPKELATEVYEFNGSWVDPINGGDFVLQNVATGTYLNGANAWGTKASVTKHGNFFSVAALEDGIYTLDSHIANNATDHFLGSNGYVDAGATGLAIDEVAEGIYTIQCGGNYLATNANNTEANFDATEVTEAAQWKFISKADILAAAEEASQENPVDMTALIGDANFGRNNQNKSAWQAMSYDGTAAVANKNLGGGAVENFCGESWRSNNGFNIYQTLTNIPNGLYLLSAQAAMNNYDGLAEGLPVVYGNDVEVVFNDIQNGEASMTAMSNSFTNGMYGIENMKVLVENNEITIGVKSPLTTIWAIFDNFELYYLGEVPPVPTVETSLAFGGENSLLNTHSAVSIDAADGIVIDYIAMPNVVGASVILNKMNLHEDEEGIFWTVGEEILAEEVSVNGRGYFAFEEPMFFEQGTKWQLTVTTYLNVGEEYPVEQVEIYEFNGSYVEPVVVTPALILGADELTLNDHSAVSVDAADALKVNVENCPEAIGVSYVINEMVMGEDAEGTFWHVGAEVAAGELSMNGIAYGKFKKEVYLDENGLPIADSDTLLYFEQGKKYQLTVTVYGQPANDPVEVGVYTYEFNGAYAQDIAVTPAIIAGKEEYALNDHSNVTVPFATALKVNVDNCPEAVGATYAIHEMVMGSDAEGMFWHAGAELAAGEMSMNNIAYADLGKMVYFEYGKKYQVSVTVYGQPANAPVELGTYTYELNGSFETLGTAFTLTAGGGCAIAGTENAPRKFTFTGQWSSTNPSIQDFSADEYSRIVVEFAEPLDFYYNTPYKNANGDVTTWSSGSGMQAGATEWTVDVTEDIYGLFIQNTQASGTNGFTIKSAYAEKKDGSIVPLVFQAPGWNGSMQVLVDPMTSVQATLSQQWGGLNISNDILNMEGTKVIRIYSNTPLTDVPVQWCIKTVDGADAWPSINVSEENPYYAECVIRENLQSIYLQYTASGLTTNIDIKAITWDIDLNDAINDINVAAPANGKYLKNGKVVIVKNGKKYDVMGNIVK